MFSCYQAAGRADIPVKLMLAGAAIFFMALGGPLPSGFVTPGYLLFFIAAAIGFAL